MAVVNGGPVKAPDPGVVTIESFVISGNFTNPQYVGSYIDCTGLMFTLTESSSQHDTAVINGASLENGEWIGTANFNNVGKYASSTITASPSQFTSAGTQTVTFTLEYYDPGHIIRTLTDTISVTVQSLSTIKNVYAFTADGRRAIIGTIEVAPPGPSITEVTIVNPNNSAVFYNIPEGTSIYLDAAGTQPVVACQTKITGTTVYMSGDGDCEYIYNDGIDYIMVGDYSVNKIDYSFLSARYADGSLTTCVETSYPVVSNQEA